MTKEPRLSCGRSPYQSKLSLHELTTVGPLEILVVSEKVLVNISSSKGCRKSEQVPSVFSRARADFTLEFWFLTIVHTLLSLQNRHANSSSCRAPKKPTRNRQPLDVFLVKHRLLCPHWPRVLSPLLLQTSHQSPQIQPMLSTRRIFLCMVGGGRFYAQSNPRGPGLLTLEQMVNYQTRARGRLRLLKSREPQLPFLV